MKQRTEVGKSTANRKDGSVCDQLRKQLTVRLTVREYDEIVMAARSEGRTASNYLRRLIFKEGK